MATKPSSKTEWTLTNPSFGTVTVEPSGAKKITGWQAAERPAHQYMNWIHYITDAWVKYFEDPVGQIATVNFAASPYTATSLNRWLAVDTSGGNVTINLPAVASNSGVQFLIAKTTSDTNSVVIDPSGDETIGGAATKTLYLQDDFVVIKQMNSRWVIVAERVNGHFTRTASTTTSVVQSDLGGTILIDSTSGVFDLDLPAPKPNFFFFVKDVGGALSSNNVTLDRNGSEEIEGLASDYLLQADFGFWKVFSDGTDWFVG
jgi:hypothetical protein